MSAVTELVINAEQYRQLYTIEDNGLHEQAPTYDSFVQRTQDGFEWATELTVSAMARSLDVVIRVVSSATSNTGQTTAVVHDYGNRDHTDRMITVAYNAAEAHYLGISPL